MPSKSPKRAVDEALDRLQDIAQCVTGRPIIGTGHRPRPHSHFLGFAPHREPVPVRSLSVRRRLLLWVAHDYEVVPSEGVVGGYEVRTISYRYQLLDRDRREILAYHWHPTGRSSVTFPHLHLSGRLAPLDVGRGQEPVALGEMHMSSGYVTFADVVRLLIAEFGVEPRRPDWAAVLDAHHDPFAADR